MRQRGIFLVSQNLMTIGTQPRYTSKSGSKSSLRRWIGNSNFVISFIYSQVAPEAIILSF